MVPIRTGAMARSLVAVLGPRDLKNDSNLEWMTAKQVDMGFSLGVGGSNKLKCNHDQVDFLREDG